MDASKVYFTTFKATSHENLLQKFHRLLKTAGIENIDFEDKYAAIKIHFGEYGNLAFLRPNYAKVVADYVKELGGKPFLTDCNTLADLCNKMPANPGSVLAENIKSCDCHDHDHDHHDNFVLTHPDTEWESCLNHAEKIGLGTRQYDMVTI